MFHTYNFKSFPMICPSTYDLYRIHNANWKTSFRSVPHNNIILKMELKLYSYVYLNCNPVTDFLQLMNLIEVIFLIECNVCIILI